MHAQTFSTFLIHDWSFLSLTLNYLDPLRKPLNCFPLYLCLASASNSSIFICMFPFSLLPLIPIHSEFISVNLASHLHIYYSSIILMPQCTHDLLTMEYLLQHHQCFGPLTSTSPVLHCLLPRIIMHIMFIISKATLQCIIHLESP